MPTERRRGRPRKQPDALDHQIAVRLTDQEHAAFCQLAAGRFLTPAELARELIRAEIARSTPPASRRLSPAGERPA